MPCISVHFREPEWKGVREPAEEERDATRPASVAHVIRQLVARRLRERHVRDSAKHRGSTAKDPRACAKPPIYLTPCFCGEAVHAGRNPIQRRRLRDLLL